VRRVHALPRAWKRCLASLSSFISHTCVCCWSLHPHVQTRHHIWGVLPRRTKTSCLAHTSRRSHRRYRSTSPSNTPRPFASCAVTILWPRAAGCVLSARGNSSSWSPCHLPRPVPGCLPTRRVSTVGESCQVSRSPHLRTRFPCRYCRRPSPHSNALTHFSPPQRALD
jgi:hypothetical protein